MVDGSTLLKARKVYKSLLQEFPWKNSQKPIKLFTDLEETLNYFKLPYVVRREDEHIADGIGLEIGGEVRKRFDLLPSEQPVVFYHGTQYNKVPSILQDGLLVEPPTNSHGDLHLSGRCVYLASSFRTAQYFAGCNEDTVLPMSEGAVIEIVRPKNKIIRGFFGISFEAISTEDITDISAVYLYNNGRWRRYKVKGERLDPYDNSITTMPLAFAYIPPPDFDTTLEVRYEERFGELRPVIYQNRSELIDRLSRILKSSNS